MKDWIKKLLVILLIIVLIVSVPVFYFRIIIESANYAEIYETNDINDFGVYTGNSDNETPAQFITSFFPTTIENSFSDVIYHYKAKNFDTYAYEAYLEFAVPDQNTFHELLMNFVVLEESIPFRYDNSYMEYSISNVLYTHSESKQSGAYSIGYSEVGKILYSEEEQRFIFWALGVYDGGGTDTSELNYFFKRFNIDVTDYRDYAFFSHEDQKSGIIYKERS